MQILYY